MFVEFDVTPEGHDDQRSKLSTATNSCLNRAATRSVERWKYQPKIVDNEAQWRRGVQTAIVHLRTGGMKPLRHEKALDLRRGLMDEAETGKKLKV